MHMHPRIQERRAAVAAAQLEEFAAQRATILQAAETVIATLTTFAATYPHPGLSELIHFWETTARIMRTLDPTHPGCSSVLATTQTLMDKVQHATTAILRDAARLGTQKGPD
ncbi:hypothetical protein [Azospirillum canadense]|uniref:hypothetical protein n=1 Tax=Azospirillum canadense TaxID=403962 RepID=UPI002227573B|nr:hypothetical protein [Azospirillum canadense]MCW2242091.1 hypothetical protein [Azospirillum canadense]